MIGIDEISISKGHTYCVIVSDLERERPIWVGGEEVDIDLFSKALGKKCRDQTGGHGYVEAIQELGDDERPECPDHLR